jgi:hypothetical protein
VVGHDPGQTDVPDPEGREADAPEDAPPQPQIFHGAIVTSVGPEERVSIHAVVPGNKGVATLMDGVPTPVVGFLINFVLGEERQGGGGGQQVFGVRQF